MTPAVFTTAVPNITVHAESFRSIQHVKGFQPTATVHCHLMSRGGTDAHICTQSRGVKMCTVGVMTVPYCKALGITYNMGAWHTKRSAEQHDEMVLQALQQDGFTGLGAGLSLSSTSTRLE